MSKKDNTDKTVLIVGGVALAALLIYPKIKEDLKNTLSGAIPDLSGFFDSISAGIGNLGNAIGSSTSGLSSTYGLSSTLDKLLKDAKAAADDAAAAAAKAAADAAAAAAQAAVDAGIKATQDAWAKFIADLSGRLGGGDNTTTTTTTTTPSWTEKVKRGAVNLAEGALILGGGYAGARYIVPVVGKVTGKSIENVVSKLFWTRTAAKTARVVNAGNMGVEALGPASATKGFPLKYNPKWLHPTNLGGLFGITLPLLTMMPGFYSMIWNPLKAWSYVTIYGQPPGTYINRLWNVQGQPMTEEFATRLESLPISTQNVWLASGLLTERESGGGDGGGYQSTAPPYVKVSGHPTEKEKAAFYAYYKAHGGV